MMPRSADAIVNEAPAKSHGVSKPRGCYNDHIAPKFDRRFGSSVAEVPVKFQSDQKSLNLNLAASRLHEILR